MACCKGDVARRVGGAAGWRRQAGAQVRRKRGAVAGLIFSRKKTTEEINKARNRGLARAAKGGTGLAGKVPGRPRNSP